MLNFIIFLTFYNLMCVPGGGGGESERLIPKTQQITVFKYCVYKT